MPSFKSGLRNSYRVHRRSSKEGEGFDDSGLTDFRKRGSSLPANSSSISVRLLPSLRHSVTDPDIWTSRDTPKGVIETDYLVLPPNCTDEEKPVEKSEIRDNAVQKESESNANLHREICRDLQKAFLEGLGQRMISRRGRNTGEGSSYNLLLNADLLDRVSLDIVRMSEREPSGLSGCRLRTRIERQHSADMDLGYVRIDENAEETFEIVLSLRECPEEKRNPGLLRNVSSLLSNLFSHSLHRDRAQPIEVHLGDVYQLEKIKLRKFHDSGNFTNIGLCTA